MKDRKEDISDSVKKNVECLGLESIIAELQQIINHYRTNTYLIEDPAVHEKEMPPTIEVGIQRNQERIGIRLRDILAGIPKKNIAIIDQAVGIYIDRIVRTLATESGFIDCREELLDNKISSEIHITYPEDMEEIYCRILREMFEKQIKTYKSSIITNICKRESKRKINDRITDLKIELKENIYTVDWLNPQFAIFIERLCTDIINEAFIGKTKEKIERKFGDGVKNSYHYLIFISIIKEYNTNKIEDMFIQYILEALSEESSGQKKTTEAIGESVNVNDGNSGQAGKVNEEKHNLQQTIERMKSLGLDPQVKVITQAIKGDKKGYIQEFMNRIKSLGVENTKVVEFANVIRGGEPLTSREFGGLLSDTTYGDADKHKHLHQLREIGIIV